MRRVTANLLRGLRHGLVGLAVVAVLMVSFKVHLHAVADDCACHGGGAGVVMVSLSSGLIDCTDAGNAPGADRCCDCHCPGPTAVLPESAHFSPPGTMLTLNWQILVAILPDGVSHPPDPPPVLLS